MKARLFDHARVERSRKSKALVHLDKTLCPECGQSLTAETVHEDALLRHGGHGATRTSTRLHCRCGWSLLTEMTETRPPRRTHDT